MFAFCLSAIALSIYNALFFSCQCVGPGGLGSNLPCGGKSRRKGGVATVEFYVLNSIWCWSCVVAADTVRRESGVSVSASDPGIKPHRSAVQH
jgi:hypothetical protein